MSENRKALPKFFKILVVSILFGFIVGLMTGYFSGTNAPEQFVLQTHAILAKISPASIWIVIILFGGLGIYQYFQAKKLFESWDGEEEKIINQAELKISWSILYSNIAMILNFFFFGCASILNEKTMLQGILGFLVSIVLVIFLQQKSVDLTRKMNPEKQGSVYDPNFQKKWLASCDENEVRQIGQAAFKSWTITNYTCIGFWLVILIVSPIIEDSIFSMVVVTVIWAVLQISYILESIRITKM